MHILKTASNFFKPKVKIIPFSHYSVHQCSAYKILPNKEN